MRRNVQSVAARWRPLLPAQLMFEPVLPAKVRNAKVPPSCAERSVRRMPPLQRLRSALYCCRFRLQDKGWPVGVDVQSVHHDEAVHGAVVMVDLLLLATGPMTKSVVWRRKINSCKPTIIVCFVPHRNTAASPLLSACCKRRTLIRRLAATTPFDLLPKTAMSRLSSGCCETNESIQPP